MAHADIGPVGGGFEWGTGSRGETASPAALAQLAQIRGRDPLRNEVQYEDLTPEDYDANDRLLAIADSKAFGDTSLASPRPDQKAIDTSKAEIDAMMAARIQSDTDRYEAGQLGPYQRMGITERGSREPVAPREEAMDRARRGFGGAGMDVGERGGTLSVPRGWRTGTEQDWEFEPNLPYSMKQDIAEQSQLALLKSQAEGAQRGPSGLTRDQEADIQAKLAYAQAMYGDQGRRRQSSIDSRMQYLPILTQGMEPGSPEYLKVLEMLVLGKKEQANRFAFDPTAE